MAKFHFRLETLLRLRETVRDGRRVHLAEAQRTDAELQSRLERIETEQKQLHRQHRTAGGPGEVNPGRLIEIHQHTSILRSQEEDIKRQRETLAAEIEQRREALLAADRDVRTLEKLRENQEQIHRLAEERREHRRIDEAALYLGDSATSNLWGDRATSGVWSKRPTDASQKTENT